MSLEGMGLNEICLKKTGHRDKVRALHSRPRLNSQHKADNDDFPRVGGVQMWFFDRYVTASRSALSRKVVLVLATLFWQQWDYFPWVVWLERDRSKDKTAAESYWGKEGYGEREAVEAESVNGRIEAFDCNNWIISKISKSKCEMEDLFEGAIRSTLNCIILQKSSNKNLHFHFMLNNYLNIANSQKLKCH